MKLLDRYIARQYLINILALLVILFSFVVTIDVSLNFDRFVDGADKLIKSGDAAARVGGLRRVLVILYVIADLWWPRLLQLFNFLIGMVLVGAMGFTCTQLVRHRELVAMLASGQSLHRVARPVLIVALGFTLLQALNQELVIPRVAPLLTRDHGDAGKKSLGSTSLPLSADGQGRLFYAREFDADRGVLSDLYIWERDADGLADRRIFAASAAWRDGGWDLLGGYAESRRPGEAGQSAGLSRTTIDRVLTDLDPTAIKMRRYAGYSQSLAWRQVGQMLARPELIDAALRERLERIRVGRISVMLANLLTLVITLPFFLRREPTNMVLQSLKCAPVGIISLMGGVLGSSAGIPGVPAALGVFIPVMVLLPIAIASTTSIKT
ncbi:MAG: LptF/LptG family permease [Phycisphaerales bacterium]|nr:LptF/LptG family permease [Phycisphaerales bacterium]